MNEWLRASGCLNGYCEWVPSINPFYNSSEVSKVERGLTILSEWTESKWETIMTENRKEIESVSQNL